MSPPMPWWKRWPNRVRFALTALKYRAARWLHRWVLPSRTKASTDTMGDWKRIQALPDDAAPRLVRPKDGPYADLINRVRLYAQNGAKALAPLLDRPLPPDDLSGASELYGTVDALWDAVEHDDEADAILTDCYSMGASIWDLDRVRAIHAAYNSPWTVKDGEVYEVVTEPSREETIQ